MATATFNLPSPSESPEVLERKSSPGDVAIVGAFLRQRLTSPKEWTLCLDRFSWQPGIKDLAGLKPEEKVALWLPGYVCTESHGVALLLGSTPEQRKQYPTWPRMWLQFSPVGFDADRKRAGLQFLEVTCSGDSLHLWQGWAVFRRLPNGGWKMLGSQEREVPVNRSPGAF